MYKDTAKRALAKTLSWRICATLATILIVYVFIGDFKIASAVGGVEVIAKMLLYFFHERVWNKIQRGRRIRYTPLQEKSVIYRPW